jgi:glycosyltransferase involved in cell wall biosynthesis
MIVYTEKIKFFKPLNIGITYFNSQATFHAKLDIIHEFQCSKKRLFSREFCTLFIDLTLNENDLFDNFAKNTKYEINRAVTKDNIIIDALDPKTKKEVFYGFYNDFAKTKGRRPINQDEINLLIKNNMLILRTASYNNEIIVIHSYITENNRARLMHSASLFRNHEDNLHRNLIGRANRLLHWEDIKYFKELKYLIYDFGGINLDPSNNETEAINKFKKGFGGKLFKEYKSIVPVSIKGFLYLCYKKTIDNLKTVIKHNSVQKKLRIAITIDDVGMGGAQHMIYEMVKNIDCSRYDVTIVCTEDRRHSLLEQQMLDEGYRIIFLKLNQYFKIFELYYTLRKIKPDIVHAHQRGILAAFWTLLNGVYLITTIHTNPAVVFKWWLENFYFKLSLLLRRNVVVAISKYNYDLCKNYWHLRRKYIRYINNGIDIPRYYNKPHDICTFINISRQDRNKNQSLILRAFARLYNENSISPVKLFLIGGGKMHETLKSQAENLKINHIVEFTGYIANPGDYLAVSDVYVSSSHREGLSLSVLEAMASKLPIIATDAGGVRDLAQDNGFLIKDDDEDALFAAMKILRDNYELRIQKGNKSFEMVQNYSSVSMTNAYCSIYRAFSKRRSYSGNNNNV